MVGFGSSLRMSRRRGWEDAYLDYQSLRLLLTQIETVYEEEDYKKRGSGNNNNITNTTTNNAAAAGGGRLDELYTDDFINVEEGNNGEVHSVVDEEDMEEGEEEGWKGFFHSAIRNIVVTGKKKKKKKKKKRKRRRRYTRRRILQNNYADNEPSSNNHNNNNSNWVSTDYFDYSPEHHHHHYHYHRKRKKDNTPKNRALDKGGWGRRYEEGMTDYRDELFLVSDEDVAYGIYDDEEGDEEGEWVDVDDYDDEEEDSIHDNDEDVGGQYYGNNNGTIPKYDGNNFESSNEEIDAIDRRERSISIDNDGVRSDMIRNLTTANSVKSELDNEDTMPLCHSPLAAGSRKQKDDLFGPSMSGLLQTPDSHAENNNNNNNRRDEQQHKVQFSDSPGVLEAGYETFATAAARRGYTYSPTLLGDDNHDHSNNNTTTAGSPSEQQGRWLDFIPGILSKGGKQQQQQLEKQQQPTSELNPLLSSQRGSSHTTTVSKITADDSPHHYTHFSEAFHTNRSTSVEDMPEPSPSPPKLTKEDGDEMEEDAVESFIPLTPSQTQLFTESNNYTNNPPPNFTIPVRATAVGSIMPETPVERLSPAKLITSSSDHQQQQPPVSKLGFGVSLNMIPTESSELLHPSSPRKTTIGMSQFYSFQNSEEDDEYHQHHRQSRNQDEDIAHSSPPYNNLDQTEEYDGGCERQYTSNNMINFYSGGGDQYFSVRSPTKTSRRSNQQPVDRHSDNTGKNKIQQSSSSFSSAKKSSGGKFILGFLFGSPDNSAAGKRNITMASSKRLPSQRSVGVGSKSSSFKSVRTNRSSASSRQKKRAASSAKRKIRVARAARKRVPQHIRLAHARASSLTERFRGLLRAEVEKVILFANSRLGELSDTIGSLRFSQEDGQGDMRKQYPSLTDGGMHQLSSSDSDGGDSDAGIVSTSSMSDERDYDLGSKISRHISKSDSSKDETKKQIMLRDRLRISRPMFQKADFLGEDFSLLSAVDEADAYTAVGVELLHLLKYVCINIIAVRKICAKHDRLLSNRMLGGYYKRLATEANKTRSNKQQHLFGLGEQQPQFGGKLSNERSGYTTGVYDLKIQHIANSTTMQTVSSALAIALTDFEASQSRQLGLGFIKKESDITTDFTPEVPSPKPRTFTKARLKDSLSGQCFTRDDEESTVASEGRHQDDDNASTSSNVALTRLQFVVTSIYGLREAARFKSLPFEHYTSRLLMVSLGPNITGDGLDGCSSDTLNFLCSYQPDAAYTLDMETVYASLVGQGKGSGSGIGGVFVASLAAAASGYDLAQNRSRFRRQVAACMSINPQATGDDDNGAPSRDMEIQNILRLNAASVILYLANYYSVIPTAHIYASSLGYRGGAAALISVANIGVITSSIFHVIYISKPQSFIKARLDLADFRPPLILCSIFAIVGNVLYSYSLTKVSLTMNLGGRFFVGLSSAEILNRNLLSTAVAQETINSEVARLAKNSMISIAASLMFGSLAGIVVKDRAGTSIQNEEDMLLLATNNTTPLPRPASMAMDNNTQMNTFGQHRIFSLQSLGYIMAFLWFAHMIGLIFMFDIPKQKRRRRRTVGPNDEVKSLAQEEAFDSDSDGHERSVLHPNEAPDGTFEKLQTMSRKSLKHGQASHTYMQSIADIQRLVFSNVGSPTTLVILFIAKTTLEILLSSCGTIAFRYFNWSGARSGLFMGILATTILPINFSLASQRNYYTERGMMKVALVLARCGLILMFNYESLIMFVVSLVEGLAKESSNKLYYYYDGIFGAPQYILSFTVVFCSVVMLESVALALMSKVQVSPRQMKKYTIDNSFVVIILSAIARLVGDVLIVIFSSEGWFGKGDIINGLTISLILAFTAGIYIVRKHYFFLI